MDLDAHADGPDGADTVAAEHLAGDAEEVHRALKLIIDPDSIASTDEDTLGDELWNVMANELKAEKKLSELEALAVQDSACVRVLCCDCNLMVCQWCVNVSLLRDAFRQMYIPT